MVIYLLKINIVMMLLYGFYRLMFNRDTFFGWRRGMLVGILLASLLIPSMNIAYWVEGHAATESMANTMAATYTQVIYPSMSDAVVLPVLSWMDAIRYIYLGGVLLLTLRLLWQLVSIIYIACTTPVVDVCGTSVHVIKGNGSPFSFFHWIFANPDNQPVAQYDEILVHESAHAEQFHSLDIMLAELFTIFCWFNPFVWLMRREVRMNLEFLADKSVLENGNDQKTYQYHLLGLSYNKNVATISNNFNVLPLKKRIKMMNKKRTREIGKAKYLLFLPLTAALLVVSNIESVARVISEKVPVITTVTNKTENLLNDNILPEKITPKPVHVATQSAAEAESAPTDTVINGKTYREVTPSKGTVYDMAEKMPDFPGGSVALMKWINAHKVYPEEMKKAGKQGLEIMTFVVDEDGSISQAEVIRSVDPLCDADAVRLVGSMPRWNPGMQFGKPVKVRYTIPIRYSLNDNSVDTPSASAPETKLQ